MILKPGVNPAGIKPETVIAMIVANEVYAVHGYNCVYTSISDGVHSKDSYHYRGYAVDIRTRYFSGDDETRQVAKDIRERLGSLYDVVIESDHIHIEFDQNRAMRECGND